MGQLLGSGVKKATSGRAGLARTVLVRSLCRNAWHCSAAPARITASSSLRSFPCGEINAYLMCYFLLLFGFLAGIAGADAQTVETLLAEAGSVRNFTRVTI